MSQTALALDRMDRRIVLATQAGLPLAAHPFALIAADLGTSEEDVLARMNKMLRLGVIRRIGVVPNHYALGYRANGMSVWDVDDAEVDRLGERVGALDFVTHCYRRARCLPLWPYNLFAMVHGRSRAEVQTKIGCIAALLGRHTCRHDVLYSKRILKKTGLRLPHTPSSSEG